MNTVFLHSTSIDFSEDRMIRGSNSHNKLFAVLAIATLLSACGGGGSSSSSTTTPTTAPAAPVPDPVTYDLKQLVFSWPAVADADYYRLLENPDGASGFSEVATNITALTYDHDISVHLQDWVNASYILQACNSVGCTSSSAVTATDSASPIGYFKASNTGASDQFGYAVAASGDGTTLAIGANQEDSNSTGIDSTQNDDGTADNSGAVYVFARVNGSWVQQAYIKAPEVDANDRFGENLALSQDGSTLAIGMEREDSNTTGINTVPNDDGTADDSGAVYVYARAAGAWSLEAYIKADNAEAGDRFGADVGLSGNGSILVVGANSEDSATTGVDTVPNDDGSADNSGAAYIFSRVGGVWTQASYLKPLNTGANDNFGYKVSVSDDGNTVAVSAIWEDSNTTGINTTPNDDGSANDSGAVYVFTNSGGWAQKAYIKASSVDSGDYFGASLALSSGGNTLAVGANQEDSNTTGINTTPNDDGTADDSGAVYLYVYNGVMWSSEAYLKASNGEAGDQFGYALALSNDGNRLIVTAWNEDSSSTGIDGIETSNGSGNAGAAYFFTRSGSAWIQDAYIKASNTGAGDLFGSSVDVNDDADTLLVGAFGEDSAATGVGGDQASSGAAISGAGYLY